MNINIKDILASSKIEIVSRPEPEPEPEPDYSSIDLKMVEKAERVLEILEETEDYLRQQNKLCEEIRQNLSLSLVQAKLDKIVNYSLDNIVPSGRDILLYNSENEDDKKNLALIDDWNYPVLTLKNRGFVMTRQWNRGRGQYLDFRNFIDEFWKKNESGKYKDQITAIVLLERAIGALLSRQKAKKSRTAKRSIDRLIKIKNMLVQNKDMIEMLRNSSKYCGISVKVDDAGEGVFLKADASTVRLRWRKTMGYGSDNGSYRIEGELRPSFEQLTNIVRYKEHLPEALRVLRLKAELFAKTTNGFLKECNDAFAKEILTGKAKALKKL